MNISEAAAATGLSTKAIRYYEDKGVLPAPDRGGNGYRRYTAEHLEMLAFIKRARDLGFSLSESGELLQLSRDANRTSADVKAKAQAHLSHVQQQIASLQAMERVLQSVVERCAGDGRAQCPIIDTLQGSDVS